MPNWKKILVSGSNSELNSLKISTSLTASGLYYPTLDGLSGQVIGTDGLGNLEFTSISTVTEIVKNVSGHTLYKGTPVHATGSGTMGNSVGVIPASASLASSMPATFILGETLSNEAEGIGIISGLIEGVDTSAFQNGEIIYVGINGGYTNIPPTGSNLIQNLGIVTKVHPTNGGGIVLGAGRANATPNLLNGKIFYGTNNRSVARPLADIISGSIFSYTGSFTGSIKLPSVPIGTSETNILLVNGSGNIVYRNNLSLTGAQGFQGTTGLQGNQGTTGLQGTTGAQGNQGPTGIQGTVGTQGFQGRQGPTGLQGTVGAQGNQGPTGIQGTVGTQGNQGPTGIQGTVGTTGLQGTTGAQGNQGPTGFQGNQGPTGIQGTVGTQGFQGRQGPTGLQGTVGAQGNQGRQGPQGNQGFQGITGNVSEIATVSASFASTSSMIVTHNFNSKNVIVSAYDNSDFYFVPQSIKLIDDNNVKLTFTSPSTGYVVVAKGGHLVSATGFQGNQGPQGAKGEIINGLLYTTTISGSIITINHNTNNIFPLFSAYNKDKIAVQPKKVLSINSNTIEVDFGTFFTGSISIGGAGLKGSKGYKGEKGNFKGNKGDKGNDIFPFTGTAIITGSLNVSNSSSFSHLLPKQDNLYDLGSPNKKWRDLYLTSASIYLGRTKITSSPEGRISFVDSQNPTQKILGNYTGSFTGSFNLPGVKQGSTENKVLLLDNKSNIIYRDNLSLVGAKGEPGTNAGITSYTNQGDNRVITSVSSTTINAESNLTFDGSLLSINSNAAIKLPIGLTAERPASPSDGLIRLNTSLKSLEFFYNSAWANIMSSNMIVEYLVIAGGGGRGALNTGTPQHNGGFGGAGGYKSSVYGEESGGLLQSQTDIQMPLVIALGVPYGVMIGAGATSVGTGARGNNGSPSSFYRIFSLGGGGGGMGSSTSTALGSPGGSGGGMSTAISFNGQFGVFPGSGTVSQGHAGNLYFGGGAGGVGSSTLQNSIESNITGTPIRRAAGGGTLDAEYADNLGTGSGGGNGSGGWSGVVILRYSAALTLTNSTGGLTFSTNTIGNYKVTTFTGGAGNIEFNF